jgi:hypothetical protein
MSPLAVDADSSASGDHEPAAAMLSRALAASIPPVVEGDEPQARAVDRRCDRGGGSGKSRTVSTYDTSESLATAEVLSALVNCADPRRVRTSASRWSHLGVALVAPRRRVGRTGPRGEVVFVQRGASSGGGKRVLDFELSDPCRWRR